MYNFFNLLFGTILIVSFLIFMCGLNFKNYLKKTGGKLKEKYIFLDKVFVVSKIVFFCCLMLGGYFNLVI
ncbi:Uncharacterised protein [[Clostridium] sordellii]|nr:Uncharacterised protein [[Clostridium] sordellii] [Paeniclostridium sordellii]CEN94651.1 Uncharacterised protein [[Clostridium] sordellii] [Paeniclostridium sordellii]